MNKIRLIPVLYIKGGIIVKSEQFSYHQELGNVINQTSRYNDWAIDELIYIDITRDHSYNLKRDDHAIKSYDNIYEILERISKQCFMPLSFGGGIRSLEQVNQFIRSGADKVTVNTGALENSSLINQISEKYGSQCCTVSIDYREINGIPLVFSNYGQINSNKNVLDWIKECEDNGAGEIFLNSIDRDGMANGYDLDFVSNVVEKVQLPVIACGGAGDFFDFVDLASTGVSGIAAGNIFHFTELSYPRAKKLLIEEGCNVRK